MSVYGFVKFSIFVYQDAEGVSHRVTADESHFFRYLAGVFILLPLKALGFIRRWLHDRHDDEHISQLQSQLLNRPNSKIKFGDLFLYLFILLALFAIGAGAMLYFTAVAHTHDAITANRQASPTLATLTTSKPAAEIQQAF